MIRYKERGLEKDKASEAYPRAPKQKPENFIISLKRKLKCPKTYEKRLRLISNQENISLEQNERNTA